MSRSALVSTAAAAALAAAVIASGAGGPATADAAGPFTVTKGQFTAVKKTSILALKTSRTNAKAIAALQPQATVAGVQGPKGDPGPAGGFDPSTVTRVTGDPVTLNPIAAYAGATLACPGTSIALSGGWYLATGADYDEFFVPRSYPSPTLSSWSFRFRYTGPAVESVTPYVVCAGA